MAAARAADARDDVMVARADRSRACTDGASGTQRAAQRWVRAAHCKTPSNGELRATLRRLNQTLAPLARGELSLAADSDHRINRGADHFDRMSTCSPKLLLECNLDCCTLCAASRPSDRTVLSQSSRASGAPETSRIAPTARHMPPPSARLHDGCCRVSAPVQP